MTFTTDQRIAMLRMLANVNPGTTIQWFYRETADELEQLEKSLQTLQLNLNELLDVAAYASQVLTNTPVTPQVGSRFGKAEISLALDKLYHVVHRMRPSPSVPTP